MTVETPRQNLRRRLGIQKAGGRDAARKGNWGRMYTCMLCAAAITVVLARMANATE